VPLYADGVTEDVAPRSRPRPGGSRVTVEHLRSLAIAAVAATVIGAAGFTILEGWSLEDSLYQTVMTITTVGYREVHDLDTASRVWAMIVMVTGVAIIFGSVAVVAEYVIDEVGSGRREVGRMRKVVDETRDHFILCGYGRVGSTVARELVHAGHRVVVIDTNDTSRAQAQADGHLVVDGDATDDHTLLAAGVRRARGLVATVDSDAQNVFVVLSARALNPDLFIVGRASYESTLAKLAAAGADRMVSPYTLAGRRIAELAVRPRVTDYIDAALSHGEQAFSLEEIEVAAGGWLEGRSIGDLRRDGIATLAVFHGPQRGDTNPADDRPLVAGESIIVSGSFEALRDLRLKA
jgi:voltage-gated potassium channel